MSSATTSNACCFDTPHIVDVEQSFIRVLPNHKVSVVFPIPGTFENKILEGTVSYLKFKVSTENDKNDEVEVKSITLNGTSIHFHGKKYSLPQDLAKVHLEGVKAFQDFQKGPKKTIIGAALQVPPKLLVLEEVHVMFPKEEFSSRQLVSDPRDFVKNVNNLTGRSLSFIDLQSTKKVCVSVPEGWIVQNITAINDRNKELDATRNANPSEEVEFLQIIKYPVAFPAIGTRVIYEEDGNTKSGKVVDYNVTRNGKKVEVVLLNGQNKGADFLVYSNLYTPADRPRELYNPKISNRIIPSEKIGDPKVYVAELARERLKGYYIWEVCSGDKEPSALGMKKGQSKGEPSTPCWFQMDEYIEAAGNSGISLTSFVGGEAQLEDGTILDITHDGKNSTDDSIWLGNIDEETTTIISLVVNAVRGRAFTNYLAPNSGKNRMVELFFSTLMTEDIVLDKNSFFSSRPRTTGQTTFDLVKTRSIVGRIGKSKQKSHETQDVVIWTEVSPAFCRFIQYINSKGHHPMFKDKSMEQIQSMIECEEHPELIEVFNLICIGPTKENPSIKNEWTRWFVNTILFIDPDSL